MKKKHSFKLSYFLLVILLAVATLTFIPLTISKYATKESYPFEVNHITAEFAKVNTEVTYTILKSGYYILQGLGGEGGAAVISKGNNPQYANYQNQPVYGYSYFTKGDVLTIRVGGGGCNGGSDNVFSAGGYGAGRDKNGKNPTDLAGGNGAADGSSKKNGGGGGGSATYIKKAGSYILVAAGGGGNGVSNNGATGGGQTIVENNNGTGGSASAVKGTGGGGGGYKGGATGLSAGAGGQGGSNYYGGDQSLTALPQGVTGVVQPARYESSPGVTQFGARGVVSVTFYSEDSPPT